VLGRRQRCCSTGSPDRGRDLLAVRRDHDLIAAPMDETRSHTRTTNGNSADEAKRFSGEARGAEPCRNDGERLHVGL
jgi:hypothetical protein